MNPIVVIAEHNGFEILSITHELIHLADLIADKIHAPIKVVIPGSGHPEMANGLALQGIEVIDLTITGIDGYTSEAYKASLCELFTTLSPSYILVAHTAMGRDFAPGLGVRLNGCSIAGVNGLSWEDGLPLFSRPILNGTKNALVAAKKTPCIIMVQPNCFLPPKPRVDSSGPAPVVKMELPFAGSRIKSFGIKAINNDKRQDDLEKAALIVAAGRGIGKKENLGIIEGFASLFPNAAVGASRPLVDDEWIKYRFQVGITGAKVSPKVYIACGISGSSQHLAGIMGSEMIISINSDPNAAIFNHSDFCIVEDILTFARAFERIVIAESK